MRRGAEDTGVPTPPSPAQAPPAENRDVAEPLDLQAAQVLPQIRKAPELKPRGLRFGHAQTVPLTWRSLSCVHLGTHAHSANSPDSAGAGRQGESFQLHHWVLGYVRPCTEDNEVGLSAGKSCVLPSQNEGGDGGTLGQRNRHKRSKRDAIPASKNGGRS